MNVGQRKKTPQREIERAPRYKKIMKEGVTMSKAGAKFSEMKELLMKEEEFKAEYEKLKPRYDVISLRIIRSLDLNR